MIEEVKKIKLEELNKQKAEYDDKKNSISQKLSELRSKLWSLQGEQSRGITVRGDFSFFEISKSSVLSSSKRKAAMEIISPSAT